LGGYREYDFGWNAPQQAFASSQFVIAESLSDYDRDFDLVVIGDSFTLADSKRSWLNYLVQQTGYSAIVFSHELAGDPLTLFQLPAYQRQPPKLFIYQSVERELLARTDALIAKPHPYSPMQTAYAKQVHEFKPLASELEPIQRLRRHNDIEQALQEAQQYTNILFVGTRPEKSLRVELQRRAAGLFSHRLSDQLLLYRFDFTEPNPPEKKIEQIAGYFGGIAHFFASAGGTEFLPLIHPNKLTVYKAYIRDLDWEHPGLISRLSQHGQLLRLDERFETALAEGTVDLYLPNDTHTGSQGDRITADAVVSYLQNRPAQTIERDQASLP
jgi:hypothetical protein